MSNNEEFPHFGKLIGPGFEVDTTDSKQSKQLIDFSEIPRPTVSVAAGPLENCHFACDRTSTSRVYGLSAGPITAMRRLVVRVARLRTGRSEVEKLPERGGRIQEFQS